MLYLMFGIMMALGVYFTLTDPAQKASRAHYRRIKEEHGRKGSLVE